MEQGEIWYNPDAVAEFEIIDHTADAGIIVRGETIEAVFASAAEGMFSLITDISRIAETSARTIDIEAVDQAELLVAWLNELLYLFDTEHLIFARFDILSLTGTNLKARAHGEKIDLARHRIKTEVKAATYHLLELKKEKSDFTARVILDL